ncbi:MAG: chorismate mutase [Chloroflexi bacterium RBG_16_48_8]|nr:MAG: chorismate mutase [Chloroflexi bacterium RBG_16_48_8]
MSVRGIRGAIDVPVDEPEAILQATTTLLEALLEANPSLEPQDLASVIFTLTPDLCSVYPAKAARQLGWSEVPLLCTREIPVPAGIPRIVRVLAHWNTELPQQAIKHVYLGEASQLRPDWVSDSS